MSQQKTLADVLDAAEELDVDSQAELVAVLNRRLAERVVATVAKARQEFAAEQCAPLSAAEIVREAQS